MENSKISEILQSLFQNNGPVSEDIFKVHNIAIYYIPLEQFTKEMQTALYFTNEIVEKFRLIEEKIFLPTGKTINNEEKELQVINDSQSDLINSIIKAEFISGELLKIHNLVAHQIPLENFTREIQIALYYTYQAIEVLSLFEKEIKANG